MNKEIEEIKKILKLLVNKKCSKENAEILLSKICASTNEQYYEQKSLYFQEHKVKLLNEFSLICGEEIKCKEENCSECYLSKWCNYFRVKQQLLEEERVGYTYADFFCGAGGLSVGFRQEGYKLSFANDIQECCIETYRFNHPETPQKHIVTGDINDVLCNISKFKRFDPVDVVIGGPPCQGFSMANRQRIIDDPRNVLYKSYIKAIQTLQPKFVVMENVKGMLKGEEQIKDDFKKVGYSISARVLNVKDFGVPQSRERVIFVGNRIGGDNEEVLERIRELGLEAPKFLLSDAISDLDELVAKKIPHNTEAEDRASGFNISYYRNVDNDNQYVNLINDGKNNQLVFNHKARYNNSRDIEIFGRLNPGDNSSDPKIKDIMPYKRREKIFKDKYFKLEPDKPCKTITAHMRFDCNMYIHPWQARGLTPREAARVQSYPDDYYFKGPYTKTYMQIGNSVPPLLSRTIARVIKEQLD